MLRAGVAAVLISVLCAAHGGGAPGHTTRAGGHEAKRPDRTRPHRSGGTETARSVLGEPAGKSATKRVGEQLQRRPTESKLEPGDRQERQGLVEFGRALDRDDVLRARYVRRYIPDPLRDATAGLTGIELLLAASIVAHRAGALEAIKGEHPEVQQEALTLVVRATRLEGLDSTAFARRGKRASAGQDAVGLDLVLGALHLQDGLVSQRGLPPEQTIHRRLSQAKEISRTRELPLVVDISEVRDPGQPHAIDRITIGTDGQTHDIRVPKYELLGIETWVLRKRVEETAGELPAKRAMLVVSPNLSLSTHELFPGRLTARTFDNTKESLPRHRENLAHLSQWRPVAQRAQFFNLIPTDPRLLSALGLRGGPRAWRGAKDQFEAFARQHRFAADRAPSRDNVLKALHDEELDTIVIVAHGEVGAIHFPDGTKLTVADINALDRTSGARKPVVFLVSCNTGKAEQEGVRNIADALLERGRATAVIAPISPIAASERTISFLQEFFATEQSDPRNALENIPYPWQLRVEEVFALRG